ncbi:MAG: family 78 glycoside hydrolase catalytic domain, partial [Anaerolineales bacterium]|nr:family 78 glycoside hydrolase catalytic domain [Anaerolineales bacterium]
MTNHNNNTKPTVQVRALRCEDQLNPLGLDSRRPKLSWQLASERHGVWQTAYQIVVAVDENLENVIWDTGQVTSDESAGVFYDGPALASRQRCYWHVRVWDEAGEVSAWSPTAWWEMALLDKGDWQAEWIEPVQEPTSEEPMIPMFQNMSTISPEPNRDYSLLKPPQFLRKTFAAAGPIQQARIYATAHGVYQLSLNGARVGDQELAPEPTAYDKYLQYQTYDVTDLVQAGDNVLGAALGDGWYIGRIGLPGANNQYGDRLALLLQLEIEYEDGSSQIIVSDDSFKSSTGPLVYSDLFIGERYDARLEMAGWDAPGFDDAGWQQATVADYGYDTLVAHYGEPMRIVEEIPARTILGTPAGDTVVDLGQNISGKLRMRVAGPAGTEIRLDFSETLDGDGNFVHQIRGRNKDQQDFYVTSGNGQETYVGWFTTHGFRYVRLIGYPGTPRPEDFTGLAIASDLPDTGSFTCSDERLNQLQRNIYWSQRGNLVAIPTDCPQRERAGFTGDAQIFAATASFNMAVLPFFDRWLRNVRLEQLPDGQVPNIVPYWRGNLEMIYPLHNTHTSAGWGDACIIVPWELYQAYGDERVLAD